MNLRQTAKLAPHCFWCGTPNPNGDLLCLAHCNQLSLGRGAYHKTPDIFGAIVCKECHDKIDGRQGGLSRETKHDMQRTAHDRTLAWWHEKGFVVVSA